MKKEGLCLVFLLVITGTFIFQMFLLSHFIFNESEVQEILLQERDLHSDKQSATEHFLWPHWEKAATLIPAFIVSSSTTHVTNHTTMTSPVTNHTTTTPVTTTNHTTLPVTTNYTTMPATTNHTTIPVLTNHTTIPFTTNHTATTLNHTTISPTTHNRTSVSSTPFNHTTTPSKTVNYTTAISATTIYPNSTGNTTSHRTTALTSPITSSIPPYPPDPEEGDFVARSGNTTYARIKAAIQLCIKYQSTENEQLWRKINVPKNATVSGSCCKDDKATIVLSFSEGNLTFTFQKNESKKIVYLSETDAMISFTFFRANGNYNFSNSSLHMFETTVGQSYHCSKKSVEVTSGFYVNFFNVQLQAHDIKNGNFGKEQQCPEDKKHNYIIPIVIVVVLVILILIVILAYVIGRKRSHQGYTPL